MKGQTTLPVVTGQLHKKFVKSGKTNRATQGRRLLSGSNSSDDFMFCFKFGALASLKIDNVWFINTMNKWKAVLSQ